MQTVALNSRAGAQSLLTLGQGARQREGGGLRPRSGGCMCPIEGPRQGVSVLWVQVGSRNGQLVAESVHMPRDRGSWASGIQAMAGTGPPTGRQLCCSSHRLWGECRQHRALCFSGKLEKLALLCCLGESE